MAEINRAAARSLGVDFTVTNRTGQTVFSSTSGRLTNSNGSGTGGAGSFRGTNNLTAVMDNGRVSAAIAALRTMNFARSHARRAKPDDDQRPARVIPGRGPISGPDRLRGNADGASGGHIHPIRCFAEFHPLYHGQGPNSPRDQLGGERPRSAGNHQRGQ